MPSGTAGAVAPGRAAPPLRVLLCDDERLLTELLCQAVAQAGMRVVATATDARSGLAQLERHRPDVAVVDLRFPGGEDGLWLAAEARARGLPARVLLLTATPDAVVDAWTPGLVHAVLDKVAGLDLVVEAIARAGDGDPAAVPGRCEHADGPASLVAGRLRFLTPREREVLDGLREGAGTAELAHRLGVSVSTTRSHVQSVLHKLGVHSRVAAVGYRGTPPDDGTGPLDDTGPTDGARAGRDSGPARGRR